MCNPKSINTTISMQPLLIEQPILSPLLNSPNFCYKSHTYTHTSRTWLSFWTILCFLLLCCFVLVWLTKSCNVVQADLKTVMVVLLFLPSSRIKSLYHHAWLYSIFNYCRFIMNLDNRYGKPSHLVLFLKKVLAFLGSLYLKNVNSKENYAGILFGIAKAKCQTDHFGKILHHH